MSVYIVMPEEMHGGTLVRWLKRVGDRIAKGDLVAEIETDKASLEVESQHAGVLAEICASEGTANIQANARLAVLSE